MTEAEIAALRERIQLSVGQIVLAASAQARYRHLPLTDIGPLFVEPLLRNRVAIAHRAAEGGEAAAEAAVAGVAIWASVSESVDAAIAEQTRAGVFPVRLKPEDWTSGEIVWLLDVLAADRRMATSVLANFRKVAGERAVKIHPVVARGVEEGVLERLRGASGSNSSAQG